MQLEYLKKSRSLDFPSLMKPNDQNYSVWFNMANTCWVTGYLANFGQATHPLAKIRLWLKFKAMLKSKAGQGDMNLILEVEEGKLKLYAMER